jgi:hypothetical protein
MKALTFPILAAAVLYGLSPAVTAQTLTVDIQTAFGQPTGNFENATYQGNPYTNPTVAFGITVLAVDGVPVADPLTTIGFCIELAQSGDSGVVLDFQASDLAAALLPDGALRAAHLSWLMDNHAPALEPEFWQSAPVSLSLAMQLAVWEVVSDTDLSLNGASDGFRVGAQSDPYLADAVGLAESWLTGLSLAGIDATYTPQKYVVNALTRDDKQDLIYLTNIPEPSSMLLAATCSLALLRRRRRR